MVTPLIMKGGNAIARNIQEVIKPHGWCDDFMDRFEELMDEAPDEVTRKKFEKLMMEMR